MQGTTNEEMLVSKISGLGGRIANHRALADCIVCDDVTAPGLRNEMAMVLKGGSIMSSSCLLTTPRSGQKLHQGTCLAFKSQLDQPKWIHISSDFASNFPGVTKVIQDVVNVQPKPRRWKIISYDDVMVWNLSIGVGTFQVFQTWRWWQTMITNNYFLMIQTADSDWLTMSRHYKPTSIVCASHSTKIFWDVLRTNERGTMSN